MNTPIATHDGLERIKRAIEFIAWILRPRDGHKAHRGKEECAAQRRTNEEEDLALRGNLRSA